jgi:hypothetical protein
MSATYPRGHLQVNRLYWEVPTDTYFHTPDGIGCIWYESFAEAMEQTGAFDTGIIALHQRLAD